MEEILTSVNAEQVSDESSQVTESAHEEVATSQKPVQTPEQNAEFARVRRESETKAKDAVISEMYGESHGIYTYADYQKAIADQKAAEERQQFQEQNGIDPSVIDERVKTLLDQHPIVLSAREKESKLIKDNAAADIAKEAEKLGIKAEIKSWEDVEKLPKYDEIKSEILKGVDHVKALRMAYFDDIVNGKVKETQQETIKKISANGESSPGSLVSTIQDEQPLTPEMIEKMSDKERMARWKEIKKVFNMK